MLHGYEEASIIPAMSLYDSGMMQQMIAAAREQYQQGQKDLDDFYKQYGDFLSPSAADMNYYYDNTVGAIRNLFNYAQQNGIDLLRSAEGRALVANVRRNVPYGRLAQIRQSAKNLDTYNKMVAQMKANGTYSADLERYLGHNPDNWDTVKNGVWSVESPTKYEDLNGATYKWFDGLKPSDLGMDATGKYRITGVDERAMRNIVDSRLSDFTGSELGGYYYAKARQDLIAENPERNPTDAEIRQRLKDNIVTANKEVLNKKYDEDQYALEQVKFNNDMAKQRDAQNFQLEMENMREQNGLNVAKAKAGAKGTNGANSVTSYGLTLLGRGIRNYTGATNPGQRGLTKASEIGKDAFYTYENGKQKARSYADRKKKMFNAYTMNNAESQKTFEARFKNSRAGDIKKNQAVPYSTVYDRDKMFSDDSVMSYTYGYLGKQRATDRKFLDSGHNIYMKTTGRVYTAPMKDGTYSQYVEVVAIDPESNKSQKYWYRVTRTEPVKSSYISKGNGKVVRNFQTNSGFNTTPSNAEIGQWTATDAALNKAAGLTSKESGEEVLLDGYEDEDDE